MRNYVSLYYTSLDRTGVVQPVVAPTIASLEAYVSRLENAGWQNPTPTQKLYLLLDHRIAILLIQAATNFQNRWVYQIRPFPGVFTAISPRHLTVSEMDEAREELADAIQGWINQANP